MNKKKKVAIVAAIFAVIALSFILLNMDLSNNTNPTLFVSKETTKIGDEVVVTVSAKNNPGMAGFVIDLEYDTQKLAPVEINRGSIIEQGLFDSNLDTKSREASIKTTWFDVSNTSYDGDLYSVKFKVLTRDTGKIPVSISYTEGNIADQNLDMVDFDVQGANITVKR